jgi:hypothetical protein
MLNLQMKNVKTCIINVYQEKEKSIIIFMMIENTKIEFQFLSNRLLIECSYSKDLYIIIVN